MLFAVAIAIGTGQSQFPLTVESIMRGPALVGGAPRGLRWSPDGSELTFEWAKPDGMKEPEYGSFVVKRDGTGLAPGDGSNWKNPEPPHATPPTPGKEVSVTEGDLYLRDPSAPMPKRLTTIGGIDDGAKLALGGKAVVYVKGGALFRLNVADGSTSQLVDAPAPAAAASTAENPNQVALKQEEGELFKDFPRSSEQRPSGSDSPAGQGGRFRNGPRPGTFVLSPGGTHALVNRFEAAHGLKFTQVPSYVTRSGYVEEIQGYYKVGEPQPQNSYLIVDVNTGAKFEFAAPRPSRIGPLRWSPDGKHAIAYADSVDHKDEWILGFDAGTDRVLNLWDEHDDAWVGGPGRGLLGWLPDGSRFYFESENTGYAQVMSLSPDGGDPKAITSGNFEVSRVTVDAPRNRFIYISSEGSPFKRHVDAVSFDGGARTKLADLSADEDAAYSLSPNGADLAVVRSSANSPAELYINDVKVTATPSADWLSYNWIDPPIVMVPARDGVKVPGHIFKPKNWRKGGPAVLFVHGAGYLQNVYDGWSHYFREYMFHHVLADRGYLVLDMDYRGSAGYGKAWRTAIYRHMGGKDLDDEVDGAGWLVKTYGVDPERIGIYGGSYGGFLTLMAMFTAPDVFAAGAALRPVSDWANYNHGYTSEILNLPQEDKEAYRVSSPIFHAEGLKGALLICHGMVDTNVEFQDTVRLVERLIELHKTNWEVAPYPVEDHSFHRTDSWIDEYTRILDLFDRTIGPHRQRK